MPFITPGQKPDATQCFRFLIPDDPYWLAAFYGVLDDLGQSYNHESIDGLSPDVVADSWRVIIDQAKEQECNPMIGAVFPSIVGVIPDNWLLLDGAWWPIADYPVLYQRMLGTWESNATHFQLPDFTGMFVMGADGQGPLGWKGGLASVTLTEQQLPVVTVAQNEHNHIQNPHAHTQQGHQHVYNVPSFNLDVEGPGAPDPLGFGQPMLPAGTDWRAPVINQNTATNQSTVATNQPFGGGESHENRPPFIRLEYYVVAR